MTILAMALACAAMTAADTGQGDGEGKDYARFEVSDLRCVIGNNAARQAHAAWYNGVFEMASPDQAVTPFVPSFAGLNLEHYFDARPPHEDSHVFFEPRSAADDVQENSRPMPPNSTSPKRPITAWRAGHASNSKNPTISTWTSGASRTSRCRANFLGCFWASYINAPIDKELLFPARRVYDRATFLVPVLHDQTTTATARYCPPTTDGLITFQDGPPTLRGQPSRRCATACRSTTAGSATWCSSTCSNPAPRSASPTRPSGRRAHGGGANDTNPAWDFQFIAPDVELGREYGFRMRAVYKPMGRSRRRAQRSRRNAWKPCPEQDKD